MRIMTSEGISLVKGSYAKVTAEPRRLAGRFYHELFTVAAPTCKAALPRGSHRRCKGISRPRSRLSCATQTRWTLRDSPATRALSTSIGARDRKIT